MNYMINKNKGTKMRLFPIYPSIFMIYNNEIGPDTL